MRSEQDIRNFRDFLIQNKAEIDHLMDGKDPNDELVAIVYPVKKLRAVEASIRMLDLVLEEDSNVRFSDSTDVLKPICPSTEITTYNEGKFHPTLGGGMHN